MKKILRGWGLKERTAPFQYWPLRVEVPVLFTKKEDAVRQNAAMNGDFRPVPMTISIEIEESTPAAVARRGLRLQVDISRDDVEEIERSKVGDRRREVH